MAMAIAQKSQKGIAQLGGVLQVHKLMGQILEDGRRHPLAADYGGLMYSWHGTSYLGGALSARVHYCIISLGQWMRVIRHKLACPHAIAMWLFYI